MEIITEIIKTHFTLIIIITIILVLALIGYLSVNKKDKKTNLETLDTTPEALDISKVKLNELQNK